MRSVLLLAIFAISLLAEVFAGIRYGQITQDAKFNEAKADEKSAWGAGFVAGYTAKDYRLVLAYDAPAFKKSAKSQLYSISAQLVDEDLDGIKGFLGMTYTRANYTHSEDPQKKHRALDMFGGDIGLILLDDRFPRTQMELGARYLVPTNVPNKLKMKPNSHFYIGFNFLIF